MMPMLMDRNLFLFIDDSQERVDPILHSAVSMKLWLDEALGWLTNGLIPTNSPMIEVA